MSTLGLIHTVFGLVALAAGTAVVFLPKGGRWHRTLGHVYLTNMIALNASGLFIYDLFGHFGPFHWMALASLLTLLLGMVPVFTRRPRGRWLELHAGFILGSYVGLIAATASEVTSRLPSGGDGFSATATGITTAVITFIGVVLIQRYLSRYRETRSVTVRQASR